MKKHIFYLSWLYLIFGAVGLLAGLVCFDAFASSLSTLGKESIFARRLGFLSPLAVLFILESIPALIGGIGLRKRLPWAKNLVLILGFLNIVIIPVGTALGIYSIWVLLNDDAQEELSSPSV